MSDFNARSKEENIYVDDPEIRNPLELFLQEVDILFSTEKMSVLGKRDFGLSLEHMLWSTTFNSPYIESVIRQSIEENCYMASEFSWKVTVDLIKGSNRDIGVIDIHIKNAEDTLLAKTSFVFK